MLIPLRKLKLPIYLAVVLAVGFSLLTPIGSPVFADGEAPPDPPAGETQDGEGEEGDPGGEEGIGEELPTTEEASPPDGSESESGDVISDEPTGESSAEDVAPAGESSEGEAPLTQESPTPDAQVDAVSPSEPADSLDPHYTVEDTFYQFFSGSGACGGASNCFDNLLAPIQSAIDYLSNTLDNVPDDQTVYVENGTYLETPTIDGSNWSTSPSQLILQSENGSGSTTITGGVFIQNMIDFVLRGFMVTSGVSAANNAGTLVLEDVVVDGTSGNGVTIGTHSGDVVLDGVQSTNNAGDGALVDNTAGSGDVGITNSTFSDNGEDGLDVRSNGAVTVQDVTANGNQGGDGASVRGDGVTVRSSTFNDNSNPTPSDQLGNGVAAESTGASILIDHVTANGNEESGGLIWFGSADPANTITVKNSTFKSNGEFGVFADPENGTVTFNCIKTTGNLMGATMVPVGENVLWVKCACEEDKEEEPDYYTVLLSTTEPVLVNAGNGILVTFPPIEIIDEMEFPWGRVTPLKWYGLPAELQEDEVFRAGVDVEIINAIIPEGSLVTIEFYISGFLWDLPFSILWWDEMAADWVEVPFTLEPHPRLPGGRAIVEWPEPGVFVLVAE